MREIVATVNITSERKGNSGMGVFSMISKMKDFERELVLFTVWYEKVMFALVVPDDDALYKIPELGPTTVVFSPGLRYVLNIAKQPIA